MTFRSGVLACTKKYDGQTDRRTPKTYRPQPFGLGPNKRAPTRMKWRPEIGAKAPSEIPKKTPAVYEYLNYVNNLGIKDYVPKRVLFS